MKRIKAAIAALNQTPLQWQGNFERILTAIRQAQSNGAQLLALPEMSLCAYSCEDLFLSPHIYRQSEKYLEMLLPYTEGICVCVGLPVEYDGRYYNALAIIADGSLQGIYCKKNLAYEGIHYETRWFSPWEAKKVEKVVFAGSEVCIGDITIGLNGIGLGFEICEDAWVADRLNSTLATTPVDVVVNASASHFAFRKHDQRRAIVAEGSQLFKAYYLYANLLGNESGRIIYDGACLVAHEGEIICESERFSMNEVELLFAELEIVGSSSSFAKNIELVDKGSKKDIETKNLVETRSLSIDEEFVAAETLALWDYMRKSYSRGFVLSLSGGVDSACCAALVYYMLKRAFDELGLENLKKRLAYFGALENCSSVEEMMPHILLCVYQATKNSGAVTENAAEKLAAEIGAEYRFFNIDTVLEGYHDLVEGAIGRDLNWENDDLAMQNIQARVRAPGVWLLSNLRGALLLTTSNRSEAAVGYATMDGDTSGGLCPLGGAAKTFLCDWLIKAEEQGFVDAKIASLRFVNEQEPTAELRPPGSGQSDEKDLMPYAVLDRIQKLAILERLDPVGVFEVCVAEFSNCSTEQVYAWVERFFRLWSRNQWKRERYAPSFHLDDENLDPRSWCRFPILSGGFECELATLRQQLGL